MTDWADDMDRAGIGSEVDANFQPLTAPATGVTARPDPMRRGLEAIRDTSTDKTSRQLAESMLALYEVDREQVERDRDEAVALLRIARHGGTRESLRTWDADVDKLLARLPKEGPHE